jgi:hypothetical protein|tara:strand:- start:946 stop:1590 length:645 start_codon:yes stop_codon:yes gene_type:complete
MLKELLQKYKCDKSSKHSYELCYEKHFLPVKNEPINILEIGIFKGESMKVWLEYFPNATVYGIDIFQRIKENELPILKNPRVKYLKLDSISEQAKQIITENWGDIKFDFIIDDGLHTPVANRLTFLNFINFLKNDGVFFIEDVYPIDKMEKPHPWFKQSGRIEQYTLKQYQKFIETLQSFDVTHIDNRKITKQPDSYIIEIQKKCNSNNLKTNI